MSHRRPIDTDESAVTNDALEPVCAVPDVDEPVFARGSGRDMEAIEARRNTGPVERIAHPTIHVTPTDIADSEWGKRITASVDSSDLRWKWTKRGLAVLGPAAVTALGLALGWLRSSERATTTAGEREAQRLEDRKDLRDVRELTVPELRRLIADLSAQLAEVRGELRALSRLGAIRVQGPAPRPLLPVTGDP